MVRVVECTVAVVESRPRFLPPQQATTRSVLGGSMQGLLMAVHNWLIGVVMLHNGGEQVLAMVCPGCIRWRW